MTRSLRRFFLCVRRFNILSHGYSESPGIVRSALINILENAIDVCTEDKSGRPHKVIFGVMQDKNHIIFDVYDKGTGMDKETKGQVWASLYQTGLSSSTEELSRLILLPAKALIST